MPQRLLFATIGSLGDLHPCLALGVELKRRGHVVTIASTEAYRSRVEVLGLAFCSLRPNWQPDDSTLISQCADLRSGPEVLFRKLILPHIRDTYHDLVAAADGADFMIAGELVFAAPLVAEKLALPWASAILSPTSFFSAHDPSLLVNMPSLFHLRRAGWRINRAALDFGVFLTKHWWQPVQDLRRAEGLRAECAPITRDKFSPDLVLALFSRAFAQPQPDWPRHTVQTGFVFYDAPTTETNTSAQLERFLANVNPPIVFTLGSTAVNHPGNFFRVSAEAARKLGRRAILLGADPAKDGDKNGNDSSGFLRLRYAPYHTVFPRAAAIVHQGGSGTTGQSLRAGRPMLFVPYGWDQPDNAARIERQGAALCFPRVNYTVDGAADALRRLLGEPGFAAQASHLSRQVMAEDGLTSACNAIENALLKR